MMRVPFPLYRSIPFIFSSYDPMAISLLNDNCGFHIHARHMYVLPRCSFSSHRCPLFHFNTTCRTGLCTFSTSYTHCFFYHSITSMVNFDSCQRTSIFTYSAGNTSFFIDTCHSFCQCFVPLSNFVSLLYLKKVNPSVILLHKNLP